MTEPRFKIVKIEHYQPSDDDRIDELEIELNDDKEPPNDKA